MSNHGCLATTFISGVEEAHQVDPHYLCHGSVRCAQCITIRCISYADVKRGVKCHYQNTGEVSINLVCFSLVWSLSV